MATVRQKNLAKLIVENSKVDKPLNKGQMLEKVGYSKSMAKAKAGEILDSDGVKEELEVLGFTEAAAMKVVDEIMHNPDVDPSARLKATDQVFKVRGTYAPEKKLVATINVNNEKRQQSKSVINNILRRRAS